MAMNEEYKSLMLNGTQVLVPRLKDIKVVGCKWLYKLKDGIGNIEPNNNKPRLIAQEYTQVKGVDYNEVFFPMDLHIDQIAAITCCSL